MSNLITGQFVAQTAIQLFLTGIIVFFVQKSYEDRLTTKRLKLEIYNSSKREAYSKALEVAYKQIASKDYDKNALTGNTLPEMKRNKGAIPPNELEINMAFSKLYLYAGDTAVISAYYKIMVDNNNPNYTPIYYMKDFLNAINKDLQNPHSNNSFAFPYIVADTSRKKIEIN